MSATTIPASPSSARRTLATIAGFAVAGVGGFVALIDLLNIRLGYTLIVVASGGALLGALTGCIGVFSVLRRQSLLGDALSHAALPGVALAFLIFGRELWALLAGATVTGWLGLGFIRLVASRTRTKSDTAMGVVLAGWFALGVVGLTYAQGLPDARQAGLDEFIFGQAASIGAADVRAIASLGAAAVALLIAFWKPIKLTTFDPAFARASGLRVGMIDGLLSLLTVVAIVLGLRIAGVVLMVGLLIAPGVSARQWTDHLWGMVVLAALFGAIAGGYGAALSAATTDLPTGPMIVVVATAVVALSLLFAPKKGVIVGAFRRRHQRQTLAVQTALRDLYHYAWDHGGEGTGTPEPFIMHVRGRAGRQALSQLRSRKLVRRVAAADGKGHPESARWFLTATGLANARHDVHNQRLWDLYRRNAGSQGIPVVPEERDRDIRDLLPEAAVTQLESLLDGDGEAPRVRS